MVTNTAATKTQMRARRVNRPVLSTSPVASAPSTTEIPMRMSPALICSRRAEAVSKTPVYNDHPGLSTAGVGRTD